MFLKQISIFSIFFTFFAISCEENPVEVATSEIGFVISSFDEEEGDSTVVVSVAWIDLLNPLPTVTINGNEPDKDADSPYYFRFSGVRSGIKFEYIITFAGRSIQDSVYIPKALDSFWCNGVNISHSDTTIQIDSSDKYTFHWEKTDENQGYIIDYFSNLLSERVWGKYSESDSVKIIPSDLSSYNPQITLKVTQKATIPFYVSQLPTKEEHDLFVYYDIEGPEVEVVVIVKMGDFINY